jgi:hypothetical protein
MWKMRQRRGPQYALESGAGGGGFGISGGGSGSGAGSVADILFAPWMAPAVKTAAAKAIIHFHSFSFFYFAALINREIDYVIQ